MITIHNNGEPLYKLAEEIHENAVAHGWWDERPSLTGGGGGQISDAAPLRTGAPPRKKNFSIFEKLRKCTAMGRPKTTKLQINGGGKLVTENICKITSKTTVFNPKRRREIESEKSNAGKAR